MGADVSSQDLNVYARVWDIYDDYRTSMFNELYFEKSLSRLQSRAQYFDITVAVGTSTTGIAGWALWTNPKVAILWAAYAGIAASMAIIKPILRWDDKTVQYSKLFNAHSKMTSKYKALVRDLAFYKSLSPDLTKRYEEIRDEEDAIERVPQGPSELLKTIQRNVIEANPVDRFWSPPKPMSGAGS